MTFIEFVETLLDEWKRHPPPPAGDSKFPFNRMMREEVERRIINGESVEKMMWDLGHLHAKEEESFPDAGHLDFLMAWGVYLMRAIGPIPETQQERDWPWRGVDD